ncbi:hypothetical protein PWG71_22820 [Nocardiopsis sp. N85]|uniref:hypothetical protein n=1 Tax=Nocardiopsis sp. N85 TaxID=3029400 RepID=UPI00237FC52C|nr:hypothetical protein [Nocardiopsis sp. N85]MDE3724233.1 hypothetical protein [Nocardiopsis sp. N85]
MRNLPPSVALLALIPTLTACTPGPEPETDGAGFGESIVVAHPVGAHPEEYRRDLDAEALYTIDDVVLLGSERVAFVLNVEVPETGRTFGLSDLSVDCAAGGNRNPALTDRVLGEATTSSYAIPYTCAIPEDTGELIIAVEHYDYRLEFTGAPG